ncbi:leucine--tRNA ligase [Niabella hirudinis]|uniref:leucine--tRNA ligase n=1 Tax=Niabella hirudinis TaxID=1285929 RepID=UPI003EBEA7B5
MEYNFNEIEKKWQHFWAENGTYTVSNESNKPKYYVLDMFPYPSGAGLHVGHPLGYIASDIYARYKRLKGFNVLHPMGYDAFGLPAEQYAIENGIHPAVSTDKNISTFRKQLDNIGFCFDWSREVRTSDPAYYKWTQWIFLQLFESYFDRQQQKAAPIHNLVTLFEQHGSATPGIKPPSFSFTADEWNSYGEAQKLDILMEYRLAYCGYGEVNWCEALGTVLANDEVVNGVSERGGYPVVKKKLRQWYLRITEYADRLLEGLQTVDFSEAMKEMQSNWIGKSSGAEIDFALTPSPSPWGEGSENTADSKAKRRKAYLDQKVASGINFENAKANRQHATEAEDVLWQALRNRKIEYKFRRQHPTGNFIADFANLETGLIIEVDGGYHNTPEQIENDRLREAELTAAGFTVVRFTNDAVINNLEAVLAQIKDQADVLKDADNSSPLGEVGVRVYTTRPDTIFGVDFMVIAPELDLVDQIKTPEQAAAVDAYIAYVKSRSERERMAEKKITGVFTGAYAINPFDGREIPIWISEYVLAGYGTGAIMAVPCGDERDFKFAKHFDIPITNIIGSHFNGEEANATKDAVLENSGFLNGTPMREAMETVIKAIEEKGIGKRKVNYKMRDAAFSRQRYWGEPFPIQWKNGTAYPLNATDLPLELPTVDSYKPGPEGEGPLANIPEWVARELETNTMPGYAGSSWYFLRYMDPKNNQEFAGRAATDYWNQVDLYIGGTEHAVGHLLYSRMWTKALYDLGHIGFDEPFKRLVNQGMIQGSSRFVYRINGTNEFVSQGLIAADGTYNGHVLDKIHVDVNIVDGTVLDQEAFAKWRNNEFAGATFILEDGKYSCGAEVEKMSKSKFNTVNPDDLVHKYGADTFRMYEMFLGPVEMSKPWDTKGIEGVHRFLKKLWRLFYKEDLKTSSPLERTGGEAIWTNDAPTAAELKVLHKSIKKIEDDNERFSFNTGVSAFMILVNELTDLKCHKKQVLGPVLTMLSSYAPHIAEELWHALGNDSSVLDAPFPVYEAKYTKESEKEYPISINGKMRTTMTISLEASQPDVEQLVLNNEVVQKWLDGNPPKKIIYVKNKMVNVVV